jgi:hypothetical protein
LEFCDSEGKVPFRIVLDRNGELKIRNFSKYKSHFKYEKDREYEIRILADTNSNWFDVFVNGISLSTNQVYQMQGADKSGWLFLQPVRTLSRLVLRTGEVRLFPKPETEDMSEDLPGAGEPKPEIKYFISSIKIKSDP